MSEQETPRVCTNNFRQYGGNVKAIWTGGDPNHYMKAMQKKNLHILKELAPLDVTKVMNFLHGRTVMGDAGKEIYLVYHGKRYTFGSYEIFLKMNFTDRATRHVHDVLLSHAPVAGQIDNIEDFYKEQSRLHPHGDPKAVVAVPSPAAAPQSPSQSQSQAQSEIMSKLQTVQRTLNNRTLECFGDDYDGTRDDFISDKWKSLLGDTPALIYPFCARTFQLGNCLGYYLNDVACADIAGAHFLAVNKKFNIMSPEVQVTEGQDKYAFFEHLPDLLVHPSPLEAGEAKRMMKTKCDCLQFCWENSAAPWLRRVPLVSRVIADAIKAYEVASHADTLFTVINKETDLVGKNVPAVLPLVPNVTIQYRCGDNIGFGKTKYGLLPFSVYNEQRISSSLAQYIYVVADSPTRSAAHAYSNRCGIILQHLLDVLEKRFPKAVVIVKRGGDPFLDYIRLFRSQVVFCSASTFCLWPALANPTGQAYYPLTPLIGNAGTLQTAPNFTANFHWIHDAEMIKQFRHYRPWSKVIDDLEA